MIKPVMGIQLYTLRDYIKTEEDFDSTLSRLEKMGVTDLQISAIGDFPAEAQARCLKKHNMEICVTHKPFDRMLIDLDSMIDEHRTIGCDAMGIGAAPDSSRGSAEAVRAFIEKADEVGKYLSQKGMTFNYHNHDFEFKKLPGSNYNMMDLLLSESNPAYFRFIPDVAWIHYAGSDPVDILKRMKGRVKVIHFKDYIINDKNERQFVSLGRGVVNLEECYKAACELEMPYIMYEQDCDWEGGDPFVSTAESWEYMMKLSGGNNK